MIMQESSEGYDALVVELWHVRYQNPTIHRGVNTLHIEQYEKELLKKYKEITGRDKPYFFEIGDAE